MSEGHVHTWVYGGVKFAVCYNEIPGGSSHRRLYFDWFYCSECLESRFVKLGYIDNTYSQLQFNASPANLPPDLEKKYL